MQVWQPLWVVLILVVLTLVLAAGVRRYRNALATRRVKVRRLEQGITSLQELLEKTEQLPYPVEIRKTFLEEIALRYKKLVGLLPNNAPLREVAEQAGSKVALFPTDPALSELPDITEYSEFQRQKQCIEQIRYSLDSTIRYREISAEENAAWHQQLSELRAQCLAKYHFGRADHYAQEDEKERARAHLQRLSHVLKTVGPNTPAIQELYNQAQMKLIGLMSGKLATQEAEASSDSVTERSASLG